MAKQEKKDRRKDRPQDGQSTAKVAAQGPAIPFEPVGSSGNPALDRRVADTIKRGGGADPALKLLVRGWFTKAQDFGQKSAGAERARIMAEQTKGRETEARGAVLSVESLIVERLLELDAEDAASPPDDGQGDPLKDE